jgi:hypothetical protein
MSGGIATARTSCDYYFHCCRLHTAAQQTQKYRVLVTTKCYRIQHIKVVLYRYIRQHVLQSRRGRGRKHSDSRRGGDDVYGTGRLSALDILQRKPKQVRASYVGSASRQLWSPRKHRKFKEKLEQQGTQTQDKRNQIAPILVGELKVWCSVSPRNATSETCGSQWTSKARSIYVQLRGV